jgi:nitrite reductase/ring-hydroxylating ferredoxin subunit
VEILQKEHEGNFVTCPEHKAKYDVTTLKVVSGPKVSLMHPKIQEKPTYILKIERNDTDRR